MRLLVVILLILLSSCKNISQEFKSINTIPMYGDIKKSEQHKKVDKAFIKNTLQQTNGNVDSAYVNCIRLAFKYLRKEEEKTAMKRFNQAWLFSKDRPEAYYGFFILTEIEGDSLKAKEYLAMGKKRDNKNIILNRFLKSVIDYKELVNDEKGVINTCTMILKNDSQNDFYYVKRGFYYDKIGFIDKAISDYDNAIKLNTKVAEAYNNRGFIYFNQKRFQAAIEDYNKAIEIKKDYISAYTNRSLCYWNMDELENALKDLRKCRELVPNHKPFREAIKKIESELGKK